MTDVPTAPATDEPSAEELAAAQALIERGRTALMAKLKAVAPKAQELVDVDGFAALLAKATELRSEISPDQPLYAHLNAIVLGMTGVQADIALAATVPAA